MVRGLQIAIALAAVAAALVGWRLFKADPDIFVFDGGWPVGELVPGVMALALAGVILLGYRAAAVVGWMMLACASMGGLSVLCAGLFFVSFQYGWNSTGELNAVSILLSNLCIAVAYTLLPQVFPDGLLRGRLWRVLFAVSVVLIIVPRLVHAWNNWQSYDNFESWDINLLAVVLPVTWILALLIVAASLLVRLRRSSGIMRRQIVLFAVAWLVSVASLEILGPRLGWSSGLLAYLIAVWALLVVAVVAVAVVRYRLYDIRLIVRRSAVYAAMVIVLTALFAGVYALVLWVFASQLVDERYSWVAVMAAVVVLLAADPFRRRLRGALERRLLGSRSDPLRSLAALDAAVAGGADEQGVYVRIARIVADAVRAPAVTLAIQRGPAIETVADTGREPVDGPLVVPLVHRGERLGELRIAGRTPGEGFGRADRALLDQLASQAAALVYGLRRDRDIDALRRDAIEAMAEQRMSLGRDLHDGIAPLLAGAGLTADALRRGMPAGSADADEAARLATRLRTAASEVRRIAHDLQPAGGDAGLAGLVDDYVASLHGPTVPAFSVDVAGLHGATLPATVELAMSRVTLEAIANVVRHAHARSATVTLRVEAGMLHLMVVDDGVGIAQPYVSGLGITSMRSRVEALGGSFDLAPATPHGTRLAAQVPVTP